jgi:hypothetical protein
LQFGALPPDLYRLASDMLETGMRAPATAVLPDGDRVRATVAITPREEGWRAVTVDLGAAGALDRLGGGDADELLSSLGALAASGGRTLSADFAVVAREAAETPRPWQREVAKGLEPEPSLLLLWTRITLWEAVAALREQAERVEEQWDGSVVIVLETQRTARAVAPADVVAATDPTRHARDAAAGVMLVLEDRLDELAAITEIEDRGERQAALRGLLASVDVDPALAAQVEASAAQIKELAEQSRRDGDVKA